MVDGNGLENRRGETHRGFESLPLRQIYIKTPGRFRLTGGFMLLAFLVVDNKVSLK